MATVLIVEDEPLIAMMLEDWLVELGHKPLGPALDLCGALELAKSPQIDAAILDLNVRGQRVDAVAELLASREIPFAFATGDSSEGIPEHFADRPKVSKPYDFQAMNAVLAALVAGPVAAG